jgi:hypothetical protein
MPAYITQPTVSMGPSAGQQNQVITTIPCINPGIACYSFGRAAGYNDGLTVNTEFGDNAVVSKGRQFAIRSFPGMNQNSPAIGYEVTTPSAPASFSIQIEGAFIDVDANYRIIGSAITVVGSATINLGSERFNFIRFNLTSVTGGASPTIIAKLIL